MVRRATLWLAVAAVTLVAGVSTLTPGLAANLGVTARTAGAGTASVARCDTDGISPIPTISGTNVVSVTVSGIASACGGGQASLRLSNGTTASTASATVPAGGGSVVMTLAASVALSQTIKIDFGIRGP